MAAIALALVLVHAGGVTVIEHLEDAVMLNDPGDLLPHIGADNGGGHLAVVIRSQIITKVMHQRGDDHLDIGTIRLGAGCRLQRMLEPVDPVAGKRVLKPFKRGQKTVRKLGDEAVFELAEKGVILGCSVVHATETYNIHKTFPVFNIGFCILPFNHVRLR